MTIYLFHLTLAIVLFLSVNWLGSHATPFGYGTLSLYERVDSAHAFNFLYRVGAPQVYLIVVAALLSLTNQFHLAEGLWRVTALYFGVRIAFNLVMGRGALINWRMQAILATVAIAASMWLSNAVLITPERALPNPADVTTELWLIVLIFVYQAINRISLPGTRQMARQEKYIDSHYTAFRRRFGSVIAEEVADQWVEALVYAVLILEDFNRPTLYRHIENFVLWPIGLARTLGPMQVRTDRKLSDAESVRMGARRIVALYAGVEAEVRQKHPDHLEPTTATGLFRYYRSDIGRSVAIKYNPDGSYADGVVGIYDSLLPRYYSSLIAPVSP